MTDRVLVLIPARGGSRRIPGKNLATIAGIPLVAWATRIGRTATDRLAGGPHVVACSTDNAGIARVAADWGARVVQRPAALATDDATSVDVVRHALTALAADGPFATVVLLQPTSPLTDPGDVVAAVERQRADGVGVVSVVRTHPASWHGTANAGGAFAPVADDASTADRLLTGAFYVIAPNDLGRRGRFVDPGVTVGLDVDAERAVDIDEPGDLVLAEAWLAARPIRPVSVAGRALGTGSTLVIAEAGVNHDGDVELAHRLVDAAADAGADVVKFQTFRPDALVSAAAPMAAYQVASGETGTDQMAMLGRLALPDDAWAALQAHAADRGIAFLSTPFDDASADLLDALDVPAFKVGSGELTNLPFLARLAARGRPMLVSTGMADLHEVADAVDTIAAHGDPPLGLLHCVSAYPADPADADLHAMATMRRAFRLPVGWSDHTLGTETALAAVALGAAVIEKHLTLDRARPGPDHRASLEPDAFAAMTAAIRVVESSLGTGAKGRTPAEEDVARAARRSLHWAGDRAAGTVVHADDLTALRPGTGLSPARMSELIGRRLAVDVRGGTAVAFDEFEAAR